jgi:ubiquinone/menaquinone biosynthesis C-methylase UbiE
MKDNFSIQAKGYSKYRPYYPAEMISYVASFAENKQLALDVATGNGQVAIELAKYFKQVYATDISEKQLENALQKDNIIYKEERAEQTSFGDSQFDLITVAQAIHWFDFDAFYKEVYRILKPDGIFAVLGYGLFQTGGEAEKLLKHFYYDITGPYWDAERRYLDENYATIPFPFEEIKTKQFTNEFAWTFEQLIGYLETWSAVQHYIKKNGTNPVDLIRDELKESWEKGNRKVTFPLLLRIGKLKD